jgi:hypothetical protein
VGWDKQLNWKKITKIKEATTARNWEPASAKGKTRTEEKTFPHSHLN